MARLKKSKMTQLDLPMASPKAHQMALPLGDDTVLSQPKPSKSERRKMRVEKERLKGERKQARKIQKSMPMFLGAIVPQPTLPDGKPRACPCGRIYILPRLSHTKSKLVVEPAEVPGMPGATRYRTVKENIPGGFIFFDKEGPLGRSTLGGDYCNPNLTQMIKLLRLHGCKLHEREDERRRDGAAAPSPAPLRGG